MITEIKIRDALSRAIGVAIGAEHVSWIASTSFGNAGSKTLRMDLFHLLLDLEELPQYWFENIEHELRNFGRYRFTLIDDASPNCTAENYLRYCRNVDSLNVENTRSLKYYAVELESDQDHIVTIVLRNRSKAAG